MATPVQQRFIQAVTNVDVKHDVTGIVHRQHKGALHLRLCVLVALLVCSMKAAEGRCLHLASATPSAAHGRGLSQHAVSGPQQPLSQLPYGKYTAVDHTSSYGSWGGTWGKATTPTIVQTSIPASSVAGIAYTKTGIAGLTVPYSSGAAISSGAIGPGLLGTVTTSGTGGMTRPFRTAADQTGSAANRGIEAVRSNGYIITQQDGGLATTIGPLTMVAGQSISAADCANVAGTDYIVMQQNGNVAIAGPFENVTGQTISAANRADTAGIGGSTTGSTGVNMLTAGRAASNAATAAAAAAASDGIVNVPAGTFESGYCLPRQAYVVTNVTALACKPGSNLTTWEGEPVCARIDCEARPTRGNIITAAAFCRTVVEPARHFCSKGCDLIRQNITNITGNSTTVTTVTRCSCRAGNQPCPGNFIGCVCQPQATSLNTTTAYILCSAQQSSCELNCNLTSRYYQLGPLCPVIPDDTLPNDPITGPIFPRWSWDLASQGQATAAIPPGTPIDRRRLLRFLGRRDTSGVRWSRWGRTRNFLQLSAPVRWLQL